MARRLARASGLFGSLRALATDRIRLGASDEIATALSSSRAFGSGHEERETIDFGFKQVPRDAKQGLVGQVFSSVANSYDVMNDLMSGGLHRLWKDRLVEALRPFPGQEHLDVAGGTGDVGFRVLRAIRAAEVEERMAAAASGRTSAGGRKGSAGQGAGQAAGLAVGEQAAAGPGPGSAAAAAAAAAAGGASAAGARGSAGAAAAAAGNGGGGLTPGRVVVCDINPDMLRAGQQKAKSSSDLAGDSGLSFVEGNAEALPFASGSFDSYTIAFGIRNVTDRPAALREALRVLKPGGRLLVLEFSHVTQPGLKELYDAYSFAVIPRIGGLVAGDAASYQYLVESIRKFPDQETFARMIEDAGFRAVTYENMTGGIVALHSGFKL
ncbi:hypothetical protein HYH02_008921 [Chlamydomonas schloesseri]|uniref:2-methoxy-6-polyprenyl-1,4-benzoquinol methylase, mitochondrial n=1 Tax=Chlamydomonas schloesseri TaxID=2026947 RepID=A0A835WCV3_9CHLO|nr:hypothetical protein HYH02_008921 [Chlamydomonas schloesseri]|eukprot:KAG2445053.1 hypothetical protein HYH02_008921 [Chlamydomonas schloesseri]